MTIAIEYGCNQAIWQSKTAPEIQERVFATQQMIMRSITPFSYLVAGPLSDGIMEPLLLFESPWFQCWAWASSDFYNDGIYEDRFSLDGKSYSYFRKRSETQKLSEINGD